MKNVIYKGSEVTVETVIIEETCSCCGGLTGTEEKYRLPDGSIVDKSECLHII